MDDAVRRLMQAVLSFAVGSELNWVGRGQKRSFRSTRLQGVLFRKWSCSTQMDGYANDLNEYIREWGDMFLGGWIDALMNVDVEVKS